jgi:hypothetical protein
MERRQCVEALRRKGVIASHQARDERTLLPSSARQNHGTGCKERSSRFGVGGAVAVIRLSNSPVGHSRGDCGHPLREELQPTHRGYFRVEIAENVAAGKIAKTLAYLAGTGCEVRSFVPEWWNFGAPVGIKPLTIMLLILLALLRDSRAVV